MKRRNRVSYKLLAVMIATLLMFSASEFAYATILNEKSVVDITQVSGSEKPSVKQLKAKLLSVSYVSKNAKLYYKVKFTNKSSVKITKAKIHTEIRMCETVARDKIITLNLAPNKSTTVNIYMGKLVERPEKNICSLNVKKLWYR